MAIFIMETRVSVESLRQPRSFEALERGVAGYLEKACPDVKWLGSYATLGPYDYLDIFEANDIEIVVDTAALGTNTRRGSKGGTVATARKTTAAAAKTGPIGHSRK